MISLSKDCTSLDSFPTGKMYEFLRATRTKRVRNDILTRDKIIVLGLETEYVRKGARM